MSNEKEGVSDRVSQSNFREASHGVLPIRILGDFQQRQAITESHSSSRLEFILGPLQAQSRVRVKVIGETDEIPSELASAEHV